MIQLLMLACVAPASGQDSKGVPRVLLDRRLQERSVLLVGIDGTNLRYTDAAGLVRNEPLAEYLAILPGHEAAAARAPAPAPTPDDASAPAPTMAVRSAPAEQPAAGPVLELTDGQRFAGSVAPGGAATEEIGWSHPVLGLLQFKLDQVRRLRLHEGAWVGSAPADGDLVILSNGDRLDGFVESIGTVIRVGSQDGKGTPRDVPLDRAYEVLLANPATEPSPQAAHVWLRDGSVIACRVIRTGRQGELTLAGTLQESEAPDTRAEGAGAGTSMKLEDLLAVAFPGAGSTLVPLAGLKPSAQTPAGERRWTRAATVMDPDRAILGAADLEVPGPMAVTWSLPAGATRLAAQAELPRQDWTWGDCELVVAAAGPSGDKELSRSRLNADSPTANVAAQVPAGSTSLTIRVEAGPSGPIQDHVILHRPLLLLAK